MISNHAKAKQNRTERLSTVRTNGARQESGLFHQAMVNDAQSRLNLTRVRQVVRPQSVEQIAEVIRLASTKGIPISVAGGRNSMGGQQFGEDTLHLDMTSFNRVLQLDRENGLVSVESGICWPDLIQRLHAIQASKLDVGEPPWTIRQKQTGVDFATIGGSLASNIHGRGLKMPPMIADIESFQILNSSGDLVNCSRQENDELFSLAIGGFGLFGIVTQVTLRLVRRFKVKRLVQRIAIRELGQRIARQVDAGCVFGDCQYAIDLGGSAEEHEGILPCYLPVDDAVPLSDQPVALKPEDWANLYRLTRTDKTRAFEVYAQHYLRTNGQVYWSDTHQLSGAFTGHKAAVDPSQGTEVITEVCIEHDRVQSFLADTRAELAGRQADVTYGTIRFIEPDQETFLRWARTRFVCIVVNLHVGRSRAGIRKARSDFRAILDKVNRYQGTFYLTYHRWAEPHQVESAYPQVREFFRLKQKYDPTSMFQSDWYRHYLRYFRPTGQ